MIKIFIYRCFFFCLITFLGSSVSAQIQLDIDRCLSKVNNSSPENNQAKLAIEGGALRQRILSRNYWPKAALGAKVSWQSEVTSVPVDFPGVEIPTAPKDQYALTLDVNQILYDGGVTKAVMDLQAHETTLQGLEKELSLHQSEKRAIELFYAVALQQSMISTHESLIEQMQEKLNQANKLKDSGLMDKKDILEIEVKILEIDQKKSEAQKRKRSARESLALLMGERDTAFVVVLSDQKRNLHALDFENRPENKALQTRRGLLAARDQIQKAKLKPNFGLFVTGGYGNPGLNFLSDQFGFYGLGGIRMQLPLDHLVSGKSNMESNFIYKQVQDLQISGEKLERDLRMVENNHRAEITKLRDWLVEDDRIIDLRREIVEVSKAKWEGGIITTSQYLDDVTAFSLVYQQKLSHEILLQKEISLLRNLSGLYQKN